MPAKCVKDFRLLWLGACVLLAVACGGGQRPNCDPHDRGNLQLESSERLNPDDGGDALPTVVRIYQLKTLGVAETASFQEMWNSDAETLGDAMLGRDELTLYPDTRITRAFERNPEATYVVGMAVVRRPSGVSWRSILELPPPNADAQCAALQASPDQPPPAPPRIFLKFELDDYQIEGSVRVEYPPPPCAEGDMICQAERQASEQLEAAPGQLQQAGVQQLEGAGSQAVGSGVGSATGSDVAGQAAGGATRAVGSAATPH